MRACLSVLAFALIAFIPASAVAQQKLPSIKIAGRQLKMLTGPPSVDSRGTRVKVAEANPPGSRGVDIFFRIDGDPGVTRFVRRQEEQEPAAAEGEKKEGGVISWSVSVAIQMGEEEPAAAAEPKQEGEGEGVAKEGAANEGEGEAKQPAGEGEAKAEGEGEAKAEGEAKSENAGAEGENTSSEAATTGEGELYLHGKPRKKVETDLKRDTHQGIADLFVGFEFVSELAK
ncbi:hypothetical protein T439DRAFT_362448 [Meredithblackwellia eburnea MCA 4105]